MSYTQPEEVFSIRLLDTAEDNMGVDGSTPVDYSYTVPAGKVFVWERSLIDLEDGSSAFNSAHFGALGAALTNGALLTITPANRSAVTIALWKTNRQVRDTMYDFNEVFSAAGSYIGRWTHSKDSGSGIVLPAGSVINMKIQDNLAALTYFSLHIKGRLFSGRAK